MEFERLHEKLYRQALPVPFGDNILTMTERCLAGFLKPLTDIRSHGLTIQGRQKTKRSWKGTCTTRTLKISESTYDLTK